MDYVKDEARLSSSESENGNTNKTSAQAWNDSSVAFKWLFLINKYIFILVNASALGFFLYLLILPGFEWKPESSLLILGIIFSMVLSFVALYGAFKEESYFIITYNLFITVIYVISVYRAWRNIYEEISLFFYLLLCFLLAYLMNRKHPLSSMWSSSVSNLLLKEFIAVWS